MYLISQHTAFTWTSTNQNIMFCREPLFHVMNIWWGNIYLTIWHLNNISKFYFTCFCLLIVCPFLPYTLYFFKKIQPSVQMRWKTKAFFLKLWIIIIILFLYYINYVSTFKYSKMCCFDNYFTLSAVDQAHRLGCVNLRCTETATQMSILFLYFIILRYLSKK